MTLGEFEQHKSIQYSENIEQNKKSLFKLSLFKKEYVHIFNHHRPRYISFKINTLTINTF